MNKKYYIYQIDTLILNIVSIILMFIILFISYIVYPNLLGSFFEIFKMPGILIMTILLYLCFHEILHSIAYVIYGGKYKYITYGIKLELGIFYCLCKQNISKKNILHSLMYPFIFIGIITYIISVLCDLPLLLWLSIINISGCSGDIIMFAFISKLKDIEFSEMNDPIAFAIYSSNDISKTSHFGLKYIGCKDRLKRDDLKKINITKVSYIIIFILIIIACLDFII